MRLIYIACAAVGLSACGTSTPYSEKMASCAGVAAIACVALDPFMPNWQIQETRLAEDRYMLQLRMKRFHAGGDGESRVVFDRRAGQLARDNGYSSYQILTYSEGVDSALPAGQRVSEGVIQLVSRNP